LNNGRIPLRNRQNFLWVVWGLVSAALFATWYFAFGAIDLRTAQTTFAFGICSSIPATVVGFIIAWVSIRIDSRWAKFSFVVVVSMIFVPLHLQVAAWDAAFGKLGWLRSTSENHSPILSGFRAAVLVQAFATIPWAALISFAGLRVRQTELEQQALLDAGPMKVFFCVTLRGAIPFLFLSLIWGVVFASRQIAVTDIYQVGTLAEEVYLQFSGGRFDWFGIDPSAPQNRGKVGFTITLLASVWLVMTTVCIALSIFPVIRFDLKESRMPTMPSSWRLFFIVLTWALSATLLIVPIFNLVGRCGLTVVVSENGPKAEFSITHLTHVLSRIYELYGPEWQWSLSIGIVNAVVVTFVAAVVVMFARRSVPARILILLFAGISMALPAPLVGVLVQRGLNLIDMPLTQALIDRSIFGPVVATSILAMGPCLLLLLFASRKVSTESIEAAQLDGAGEVALFQKISFARMLKPICGCFLVAFLMGYNDLSASFIVMPAGIDTLPRILLGQMHAGVNDYAAGVSLVNFVVALTIGTAAYVLISAAATPGRGKRNLRKDD